MVDKVPPIATGANSTPASTTGEDVAHVRGLHYRCPECRDGMLVWRGRQLQCRRCDAVYLSADDRPVLFRADNELFQSSDYLDAAAVPPKRQGLGRLVPDLALNLSAERTLRSLRRMLDARGASTILVIGGGRQRAWVDSFLSGSGGHTTIYLDVDVHADVDLFADAHDLPFCDEAADAVVTTAVLEHVLYPERAAAEIARVVKQGGFLYSELPFIQQVHEGAYDFTRYTYSGHRRLFNQFEVIEGGMVAGPASALAWSIENFVLAFARGTRVRQFLKAAVRTALFWLKYLDYPLRNRAEAMDGACCTYLLGRKGERVSDAEIVAHYIGAKHLAHV